MNLNKKILLFTFLPFFAVNIYAQNCKADLHVKTDLADSKIFIDDSLAGKGNADVEINAGKHYIVVMEETDRWNAKTFNDTINFSCKDTTLEYYFKSEVYLDTDPQDVYVYKDSELIGHTPVLIPLKNENLILKKPGYSERTIKPVNINANEKIKLNFTGKQKEKTFFEKNIFKMLAGGIVALGGVSAYFKLKADNNFDRYQSTGKTYFLDLTHKYDLISGITFGALQVGFGFLLYYFLSD